MGVRDIITKHPYLWGMFCNINNLKYKIRFASNLIIGKSFLYKMRIINSRSNNKVIIGDDVIIRHCSVRFSGSFNTIIIGNGCRLSGIDFCIEDDANTVEIGESTTCAGPIHLACIEGKKIVIGKKCMLSGNIAMRVGDSHSIINEAGKRVNPSASIEIQDHVWLGNDVKVLKGVSISTNSIVGTGAVVSKSVEETGSVVVGNPARIVKTGLNWDTERLAVIDTNPEE